MQSLLNTILKIKCFLNKFVSSVQLCNQKEESILVNFSNNFLNKNSKEDLAKVTKEIVSQNFSLIGIEEKKNGLEEIFFDVIRSQPNAIV